MTKEFNKLSTFINEITDRNKLNNGSAEFENQTPDLDRLFVSLQNRLEQLISEQKKQEKLTLFVHYIQIKLTTLADSLENKEKDSNHQPYEATAHTRSILDRIRIKIIDILEYLHLNFSSNFDISTNLPLCFFYIGDNAVKEHDLIISALSEKNIDKNLISILEAYLNSFNEPSDFSIKTWHQYDYLINLSDHIRHFSKQLPSGDDTFKLILLLISHNFNSVNFYEFMLHFIEKRTNTHTIYEEQETRLIDLLKVIENLRQENKYGFNPDIPVIRESLSAAIKRELRSIIRLRKVYLQDAGEGEGKSKNFYFEVTGTIEDLLFTLRLLMELGFLKTKFKASLYTFVENHIKTERTKTPSAQYMRNIFSPGQEVSPKIVKKSRSTLMKIVNYIDMHFRDQLKFCLAVILLFSGKAS